MTFQVAERIPKWHDAEPDDLPPAIRTVIDNHDDIAFIRVVRTDATTTYYRKTRGNQ